jgi:hypothetical protein
VKYRLRALKSLKCQLHYEQESYLLYQDSLSIVTKQGPVVTVPPGKIVESSGDCPAGSMPTGGGSSTGASPGDPRLEFIQSFPFSSNEPPATGWDASEFNPTTTNLLFFVVFQCTTVTQGP